MRHRGTQAAERLIRLPEVLTMVGLGRSSIYRQIAEGQFPKPVDLGGGRAVAWRQSDISAWIASRTQRK